MRRLAVITGSRSEYGCLRPLLRLARESRVFELQLIVAGMHLLPQHGATVREIKADGYRISAHVPMQRGRADEGDAAGAKALGRGVCNFAGALGELKPDLVLVEGDRVEALAATIAAAYSGIPVAHSGGGCVTGTIDNAARHAISHFASLHFVETNDARDRLLRFGCDPAAIHLVGALGIDAIRLMQWRTRADTLADLGLPAGSRYLLVVFHPESEHPEKAGGWMENILGACLGTGLHVVVVYPNSDPGSAAIIEAIEHYRTPDVRLIGQLVRAFPSLSSDRYLHALRYADALAGNSSSGLLEAPSIPVQVLNVGHRQNGRLKAQNIRDCGYDYEDIRRELGLMLFTHSIPLCLIITENPYGDGKAAERILKVIEGRLGQ